MQKFLALAVAFCLITTFTTWSAEVPAAVGAHVVPDSLQIDPAPSLPLADSAIVIPKLDFSAVPLFDALTALVRVHNLSVAIDSSVTGTLTMHLVNVRLVDALHFIIKEHGLAWEQTGRIVKLSKPRPAPVPPPPLNLVMENDLLSVDVVNADIERFARAFEEKTGLNIVVQSGTRGGVTGKLSDIEPIRALTALMSANGFSLQQVDGVYHVTASPVDSRPKNGIITSSAIRCDSGLISVRITNGSLNDVINTIAAKCQVGIASTAPLEGTVTSSFDNLPLEQALISLFWNTNYTFRENNGTVLVGSRESEDLFVTKLVKLDHLTAGTVEPLIPPALGKQVSIKVVKEHNGLLLTGPRLGIAKLEAFVQEVDVPAAQVLFEVLVVDFTTTDASEFSIKANDYDTLTRKQDFFPLVKLEATGRELNDDLNSLSRRLGVSNLGKLPDDFYIQLRWLVSQGKAHLKSHPKIAALNGHSASISIGTTQYYLLESSTIYPSDNSNLSTQTSQRFEKVEADMKLEVTPYVNNSGELIVEVKPVFNSPATPFDPDIPPSINRRELNSTVRLRDGETIVLGGLVNEYKKATISKLPILGSIPLLGRLFQNRTSQDETSELMIYITPHVYYGSEGSVDLQEVLKKK